MPIYKKDDKSDCYSYWGIALLLTIYRILPNIFLSGLPQYAAKLWGIVIVNFDVTD